MDLCLIPQKYFVPLGGFGDIDVWLHGLEVGGPVAGRLPQRF